MVSVLIICIISCVAMITLTLLKPKLSLGKVQIGTYWLCSLFGAVLLLACSLISFKEVFQGLTASSAINPLKILALFLSMTVLSIFLDETGMFRYLANEVLRRASNGQLKLFTALYITVSVLTVFTSNDIIILTFTPFICYFAKNAKVSPIPYLVSEFVAANTCSMLLIIGNPTNIYLATASAIGFFPYLKVMALPTLFAVVTAYFIMLLLFRKQLKAPIEGQAETVKIESKPLLLIGVAILATCTLMLTLSSVLRVQMWLIAVISAGALTLSVLVFCMIKRAVPKELGNAFRRVPWELIPFVLSMFIMVLALDKYLVTDKLASLFGERNVILTYGFSSVFFANLINNIPMSVLFSSVLPSLSPTLIEKGVYAVIIGSNIGAFLTPIGALAGLMWLSILKDNGVKFTFARFLMYGVIIAIPVLFSALGGLAIVT